MKVYIDTSVLVSAALNEPDTFRVRAWLKGLTQRPLVSDLGALKFSSAVSRSVRIGRVSQSEGETAMRAFNRLRGLFEMRRLEPDDDVLAERLVRNFATKLLAPEALRVAAAIRANASLATFDLRMGEAAKTMGVQIAPI